MRVLVVGASGFIGSHLVPFLQAQGHEVVALKRGTTAWDPEHAFVQDQVLEGYGAIINLCGHPLMEGIWKRGYAKLVHTSRVETTKLLAEAISRLKNPPKIFLSASAIGYYGNRGDEKLTEDSSPGDNGLAKLCQEWEEAASIVQKRRVRHIALRTGMVLSYDGGALKSMARLFRWGLGSILGDGKSWISWIWLSDLLRLIDYIITYPTLEGPINAVSPEPIQNDLFSKLLAAALRRPCWLRTPRWAIRLFYGKLVEELVLSSLRVVPKRAQELGFQFFATDLYQSMAKKEK